MKEMSVCRFCVRLGENVASIEVNSDIEDVDWCGEDFLSEIGVALLCVYVVDKFV